MIHRVRLHFFKRFEEEEFKLDDAIVLAGPNNSGKSTLLQALAVWNLAIRRWRAEKGNGIDSETGARDESANPGGTDRSQKRKTRPGVRITRENQETSCATSSTRFTLPARRIGSGCALTFTSYSVISFMPLRTRAGHLSSVNTRPGPTHAVLRDSTSHAQEAGFIRF